jgi:NAD(P)-binding Rossmann-like domain
VLWGLPIPGTYNPLYDESIGFTWASQIRILWGRYGLTLKIHHTKTEAAMNFVVIGADAAGMSAASRAKRTISNLDVTVFEKTGDVSYSA